MLISEDQINLYNFNRSKGTKRFNKIIEKLQKTEICINCSHPQPEFKHIIADNVIDMVYKNKQKQKVSVHLQTEEIKKIFDNIENNDVRLLGFNPDLIHPKNLIITVFPVIPTCARPFVISEGNTSDDDLTIQLIEIIKANNHLEPIDGIPLSETKKQKYLQTLNFRVSTYFNNSCLAPDTPVLLWSGNIKRADEIKEDDELIGDDGTKRIVIHTCSGQDQMYEVQQENADTYIVNKNHVLTLKFPNHKKIFWDEVESCYTMEWYDNEKKDLFRKTYYVNREQTKEQCLKIMKHCCSYINIPNTFDIKVSEYMKLPDSITEKFVGFRLLKSVLWEQKDVIDPHTLITILLDRIDNFNANNKFIIEKYNFEIDNKVIPSDYMYNNSDTRLDLLASIVDEIGVIYDNGDRIEIETDNKYERLMKQIHFVSQSLAFFSKLEVCEKTKKVKITLTGDDIISRIPTFFIDYKKSKININKKCDENKLLSKLSVKPIGIGKYNGFIINGNHRFLLGDFTVTHNSGRSKHSTSGRVMKGIKERLTGKEGLIRMNLLGKRCWIEGTKIILWNGQIKNVEDIKVGDVLIGDDGNKRTVLNTCHGEDNMYKVIQNNKDSYIVNTEHILSLKCKNIKKISLELQNPMIDENNVIDIQIKDFLKLSESSQRVLFDYKLEKCVNWTYKNVTIDPYILGMWLADETSIKCSITSFNKESIEYLEKWASENNFIVSKYDKNYYYIKYLGENYKHDFISKLEYYDLLIENKFVPNDYIFNDSSVRMKLLAGIIDTYGSVESESDNNVIVIT